MHHLQIFVRPENICEAREAGLSMFSFSQPIFEKFMFSRQDLGLLISLACYSILSLRVAMNSGSLKVLFYSYLEHFFWYCSFSEFEVLSWEHRDLAWIRGEQLNIMSHG